MSAIRPIPLGIVSAVVADVQMVQPRRKLLQRLLIRMHGGG